MLPERYARWRLRCRVMALVTLVAILPFPIHEVWLWLLIAMILWGLSVTPYND